MRGAADVRRAARGFLFRRTARRAPVRLLFWPAVFWAVFARASGADYTLLRQHGDDLPVFNLIVDDLPASAHPDYAIFQTLLDDHPQVRFRRHSQLQVPNISRGSLMMAIAGGVAPDVLRVFHHEARSWIRNGFFEPLDPWIYEDVDGDGKYTEGVDRIIWEPWHRIPREIRDIMMYDGNIYFVPRFQWMQGLIYRKDLFREHGIDPEKPIETFEDLLYICRKLTDPHAQIAGARRPAGRRGFAMMPDGWTWQGYLYAAGGRAEEVVHYGPDGSLLTEEAAAALPPHQVQTVTRAAFNTEEGLRALRLWKDLLWGPFIKCPECGEPVDLGGADARLVFPLEAECPFCRERTVLDSRADERIIIGCARPTIGEDDDWRDLFVNGEIAIFSRHKEFLYHLTQSDLDSRLVGFMPLPELGGLTAFHYWGVYSETRNRHGGEDRVRAAAEMVLNYAAQFYVPPEDPHFLRYDRERVIRLTESGFFNFCTRDELIAAGLDEYVREIPEGSLKMWDRLYDPERFMIMSASEGYSRVQIQVFGTELLSNLVIDPAYDIVSNLARAERLANTQIYESEERIRELARQFRLWFVLIVLAILVYVGVLIYFVLFRGGGEFSKFQARRLSLGKRAMGIALLAPAALLIGLWSYYPLLRGSVMAFQDVKLLAESRFVGIENFVRVVTNPQFLTMVRATVEYVFAVLTLGFLTPIFLAILLSEIGRGSTWYRIIYYAPHVLGGVVVLFIWKIYYSPSADGFLNQILAFFGVDNLVRWLNLRYDMQIQFPVAWLQNTSINKWMLAFPIVWANMGSACLIYLAALRSFDEEMYEAAEIDGAGSLGKMWHITVASLKPLIIIQFVGAFISAFQGMGNILILTGGAYDTNVISLQIFLESFAYLRFGNAIALAWILGSVLVSFTIVQLRVLKKVEFRRAE